MGRLFNTVAERSVLDANRGKMAVGGAATSAANAAPYTGQMITPPEGVQMIRPPDDGQMIMQPMNMPPEGAQMMAPGADPNAVSAAPPPPPREQLELNGVLRTSSGRSTVWLNNVPQSGAQNKFSNRNNKALTVTLPSGKKVLLQPGQRYDLADGRVKDINEP